MGNRQYLTEQKLDIAFLIIQKLTVFRQRIIYLNEIAYQNLSSVSFQLMNILTLFFQYNGFFFFFFLPHNVAVEMKSKCCKKYEKYDKTQNP